MNLLGHEYKVELTDDTNKIGTSLNGLPNVGLFNSGTQTIYINKNVPKSNQEATLLHEIIEGINYHFEMNLKHSSIMQLESALYQCFQANGVDLSPLFKSKGKK